MRERRLTNGFARAPAAMVLVSCALAMLAAEPAGFAGVTERAQPAAMHWQEAAGQYAVVRGEIPAVGGERKSKTREAAQSGGVLRQTRILSTLAIVQRLILGAAQAGGHSGQGMGVLWFEPVCAQRLPPAMRVAEFSGARRETDGGMPTEREFAIGHQLLAPPGA